MANLVQFAGADLASLDDLRFTHGRDDDRKGGRSPAKIKLFLAHQNEPQLYLPSPTQKNLRCARLLRQAVASLDTPGRAWNPRQRLNTSRVSNGGFRHISASLRGQACVNSITWSARRAAIPPHAPQVHDFEPTEFHRVFSDAIPPVLRIFPGDTVRTWTVDAGGVDSKGVLRSLGGNPETGPFLPVNAPGTLLFVGDGSSSPLTSPRADRRATHASKTTIT
jgi:hypothetical protein